VHHQPASKNPKNDEYAPLSACSPFFFGFYAPMIPSPILFATPVALGAAFVSWYAGKEATVKAVDFQGRRLQYGVECNVAGLVTLAGTYMTQRFFILRYEQKYPLKEPSFLRHSALGPPRPPRTFAEVYQVWGRSIVLRSGAACLAVFLASVVQTYVAVLYYDPKHITIEDLQEMMPSKKNRRHR
jgi:hypothetical protein